MNGREKAEPRHDRVLELRLRGIGFGLRGRAWDVLRGVRRRTVLGLALLSLGLFAAGLVTSGTPLLWVFTGCWALTLAIALAVLRACAEGRGGQR
ncbi:hypothetical protein [Streptomyces sp. FH025]|uniref:hypothetical protein n=1 Tax=Streptomyces sp. FH025 TaxID=2815937 RepID=UPI001A9DB086|nr:hypothetical protein [Streptomyces sp. FH025]MBO1418006.1 hypothetical protein [Streptomyces sp. FH025]